jgi:beta-glucosidase/6-phospho-beta-glucosidase/beta-galactosidase
MSTFPTDFHWGYATASAQVEGSVRRIAQVIADAF